MPELPEIETIRRGLERDTVGRRVKSVEVPVAKAVHRNGSRKAFQAQLEGTKIKGVDRRGLLLVFTLDNSQLLVIDVGATGYLRRASAKDEVAKDTQVIITFTQGGQLRFVDPRTFGELYVVRAEALAEEAPELADLGVDPVDSPISVTDFARRLLAHRDVKLKALLVDQGFIAGIGNIYSDEILWEAGLRWDRTPGSLSNMEIRRLFRSVVEILHEAIKHRGSTLADQQYVDVQGRPGDYQTLHNVYDRAGQTCNRCRSTIVKEKFQGRSTFYCPSCQI